MIKIYNFDEYKVWAYSYIKEWVLLTPYRAGLAEQADAHDSKSCGFTVRVRLPHPAPLLKESKLMLSFFMFNILLL